MPLRFSSNFILVEWDEKDALFKVAIPPGKRFGKEFLAGLEVWATVVTSHVNQVRGPYTWTILAISMAV